MTMPQHLIEHLVETGVIDTDRVSAKARHRHCKDCRATVISALADDGPQVPGIRADVDPAPLTPLGELQATLLGRHTYLLAGGGLAWRHPSLIAAHPAGTHPDRSVHAAHACGKPNLDHTPHRPTVRAAVATDPTIAPF